MSDKTLVTLPLNAKELAVLDELAASAEVPRTTILRQALKLYQLAHERTKHGEQMMFTGDPQRVIEFIGIGFGQ